MLLLGPEILLWPRCIPKGASAGLTVQFKQGCIPRTQWYDQIQPIKTNKNWSTTLFEHKCPWAKI